MGRVIMDKNYSGSLQELIKTHDKYNRLPHELSLRKFTRKLLISDPQRELVIPDLTNEQKLAAAYFTAHRKELGALWTGIALYEILRHFSPTDESRQPVGNNWDNKIIPNERVFLETILDDVLKKGNRLFRKDRKVEYKGQTYDAGTIVADFVKSIVNGGKKSETETYLKHCSDTPYHMNMYWRKVIPSDRNRVALVYGRVKESNSANNKQAMYWAHDVHDIQAISNLFDPNADCDSGSFRQARDYARKLEREEPFDNIFKNRYEEVKARWYYGIGDSYGITVVFSRELTYDDIDQIKNFFMLHPLFTYLSSTDDDHSTKSNKPCEFQFKVELTKEPLETYLEALDIPKGLETLYMPDTIEIIVTSLPDLVHKYFTPGLKEKDYKARMPQQRLGINTSNDPTYKCIFEFMQTISPVASTIGDMGWERHIETIQRHLSYQGRYPVEQSSDRDVLSRNLFRLRTERYSSAIEGLQSGELLKY